MFFIKMVILLMFCNLQSSRPFHPSIHPVIRPVIHPSKFLIPEEEADGRGGRRMAVAAVYPNVYVIQYVFSGACSRACWW
jgi:hypothetical protein